MFIPSIFIGVLILYHPLENTKIQNISLFLSIRKFVNTEELKKESLKEFNSKIKNFVRFRKTKKDVENWLFEIIPKHLQPQQVINAIFNECNSRNIQILLNSFFNIYPSFSLSSYDKIRKKIVEDKFHSLNNASLIAMFKEYRLDEEKIKACYDLAYRMNLPNIYQVSRTPILPNEYTLNFLWINLNPQDRSQNIALNIFKEGTNPFENTESVKNPHQLRELENTEKSLEGLELENWENIKKTFAYRLSKWADIHPSTQINLWYDSALVTQIAQKKTFQMIQEISNFRKVKCNLRDIRKLPNIKGEIEHALHPGTNVYYRVDLIKVLITDYMLSNSEETAKYCIISDIDIEPMSPEKIFDQRTMEYLNSNGYVFNKANGFENSFFIFNKQKENLVQIHYKTMIQETENKINSLREYTHIDNFDDKFFLGAQSVFKQYKKFQEAVKDPLYTEIAPRKLVTCPTSQFNHGGNFSKSDYQAEVFFFTKDHPVPYTRHGRNHDPSNDHLYHKSPTKQIESLVDWKAEPLDLPTS